MISHISHKKGKKFRNITSQGKGLKYGGREVIQNITPEAPSTHCHHSSRCVEILLSNESASPVQGKSDGAVENGVKHA